jgi:hypothetical protein
MANIFAPVGPWDDPKVTRANGNRQNEVTAIQNLLISAATKLGNPAFNPGIPDGKIHRTADRSATLNAIRSFQRGFMSNPDRRVDPNGGTLRRLNEHQTSPGGGASTTPVIGGSLGAVQMTNHGATRNLPITSTLMSKLQQAVGAVFGSGATASVYSGGQPAAGSGGSRVGSVRHDHGRAADLTVVVNGSRAGLADMERLGQWWLARRFGCAGVGMQSGRAIHLDEWNSSTGPALSGGMGPYWTYGGAGQNTRTILQRGHGGQLP